MRLALTIKGCDEGAVVLFYIPMIIVPFEHGNNLLPRSKDNMFLYGSGALLIAEDSFTHKLASEVS